MCIGVGWGGGGGCSLELFFIIFIFFILFFFCLAWLGLSLCVPCFMIFLDVTPIMGSFVTCSGRP